MNTKASFAYFTPDCSCLGIVGECFDGWNPWSEAVAGLLIQCFLDLRIFVWLLGKGGVERRELKLIVSSLDGAFVEKFTRKPYCVCRPSRL